MSLNLVISQSVFAQTESGTETAGAAAENRPGLATAKSAEDVLKSIDANKEDPNKEKHKSAVNKCKDEVTKADKMCAASQNPNSTAAQNSMNGYTAANSAAGAASGGQSGRCGDFGNLMNGIKPMMGAYNQQCTTAREACKKTCKTETETAKKTCDAIVVNPSDPKSQAKKTACETNAKAAEAYAQTVDSSCSAYSINAEQALAALAAAGSIVASMMNCQQDQGKDPSSTDPATQAATQCTLSSDTSNCMRGDAGGLAGAVTKGSSADTPAGDTNSLGLDKDPSLASNKRGAAGGGGGLPHAPGGGGVGGRGGVSDAKSDALPGAKAIDTNISGGEYSGGGRGVAGGGGYPDAVDATMGAALQKAEDRKNGASAQFTGGNGRSNWQKIRDSYRANSARLDY